VSKQLAQGCYPVE